MKKVKYVLGTVAILAAVMTMSFTTTSNMNPQDEDCWRSPENVNVTPPDIIQSEECPGLNGDCCYKEGQSFAQTTL